MANLNKAFWFQFLVSCARGSRIARVWLCVRVRWDWKYVYEWMELGATQPHSQSQPQPQPQQRSRTGNIRCGRHSRNMVQRAECCGNIHTYICISNEHSSIARIHLKRLTLCFFDCFISLISKCFLFYFSILTSCTWTYLLMFSLSFSISRTQPNT